MTRINLVPPAALTDQHLVAEWRELPRIFGLARPLPQGQAPRSYVLGAGHVLFFYNKTPWLVERHKLLTEEFIKRGFKSQLESNFKPLQYGQINWSPSPREISISLGRLHDKLMAKPAGFYRFYGRPVDHSWYGGNC